MGWQIRTRGDVRRFTLLICLVVLAGGLLLRPLILPPDLAAQTIWPGAIMALMLSAPIAFFVGERLHRVQQLSARLEHALRHDPLTGVRSRRSLYESAEEAQERGGSVIVADIDHFKGFNDRYGHAAGDAALCQFARLLSRNCRAGDLVARVGGEEFVLVLRDTTTQQGFAVARRLACRIRQSPVLLQDRALGLTASFGVAALPPGGALDPAIRQADRALYRAKRAGRDRACLYQPELDDAALPCTATCRITARPPAPSAPHRTDSGSAARDRSR